MRGLWNYFFRKDEFYIVILGLDNAGKTVSLPLKIFPGAPKFTPAADASGEDEKPLHPQLQWHSHGQDHHHSRTER